MNIISFGLYLLLLISTIIYGLILSYTGPASFDTSVLLWFRVTDDSGQLIGPHWIKSFWLTLTWLGDSGPRIGVVILTIVGLSLFKQWHRVLFTFGTLLSGMALISILKIWIARPRPDLVTQLTHFSSASFPSGHTFNTTLFYLTVVSVISPFLSNKSLRRALITIAIFLSLATGISRIALGVHWPSDVLASWIMAVAWLGLWAQLARYYWPRVSFNW